MLWSKLLPFLQRRDSGGSHHNDIQHNKHAAKVLRVIMRSVAFSYCNAECSHAAYAIDECCYAECRGTHKMLVAP